MRIKVTWPVKLDRDKGVPSWEGEEREGAVRGQGAERRARDAGGPLLKAGALTIAVTLRE